MWCIKKEIEYPKELIPKIVTTEIEQLRQQNFQLLSEKKDLLSKLINLTEQLQNQPRQVQTDDSVSEKSRRILDKTIGLLVHALSKKAPKFQHETSQSPNYSQISKELNTIADALNCQTHGLAESTLSDRLKKAVDALTSNSN